MSLSVEILELVLGFLLKPFKWLFNKVCLCIFQLRDKKPPLKDTEALKIAISTLSGEIERAVGFRNINTKHIFIAGIQKAEKDFGERAFVLEQFGRTYRTAWTSESLTARPRNFEIADINDDGIKEVIFTVDSFGSGAGMKTMFVYSTANKQLVKINELYDWQHTTQPVSPVIEIEPEMGIDDNYINAIETYAVKLGLLQERIIDLNSLKYAQRIWHGNKSEDKYKVLKLFFYKGKPSCNGSIISTLKTNDVDWVSCFKGPLFAYIKSKDQYFIAYSPYWIYDWVTSMTFCGEKLWFVMHSKPGIMSFELDLERAQGYLNHFTHYKGQEISAAKIDCIKDKIILDDKLEIPIRELSS